MNKEKYLAKIKKLLNLAKRSTNPNEAANALRQAQNLMREHQLNETDVALTEISEASSKGAPSDAISIPRYMSSLLTVIRQAFGVQNYLTWQGNKRTIVFYGPNERPQIAAYAFDVLSRQMMSSRRAFSAKQRSNLKRTTKIGRADSYCEAWVSGAYTVIERFVVTNHERELMDTYYQRISDGGSWKTVATREAKKVRGVDDAASAGYRAGKNASLHHAVNGTDSQPALIGRS
ncbi:DUF2786 domain-containing protein [Yersinia enterocolitica]|uniref:DUF2786 domain-containing protein n=1 Tax=Yersinia enterocolitica TaxID=630 RepID=UPI002AF95374|nr:DUF2786 domain-containing protein [Yersinia enterocolitica]